MEFVFQNEAASTGGSLVKTDFKATAIAEACLYTAPHRTWCFAYTQNYIIKFVKFQLLLYALFWKSYRRKSIDVFTHDFSKCALGCFCKIKSQKVIAMMGWYMFSLYIYKIK